MTNKYGPSPKYILNWNNIIQDNNYIPPNGPINQFPQLNSLAVPVNYPNQQKNNISPQNIPYPQQNPVLDEGIHYPQSNT